MATLIGTAVLEQLSLVRRAHNEVWRHELQFTVSFT
jgi:hypothetical protein